MPLNLPLRGLDVIQLVDGGLHLQAALDRVVLSGRLSARDAAALADLVYGFFRRRLTLTWILDHFLKNPRQLPPKMLLLLQLGVTALLYQDKNTDYAVVDRIVELVKKRFGKRLAGVANGVLRNIARRGEEFLNLAWFQEQTGDSLAGAAVFYGIPLPIAKLWAAAYGGEAACQLMARSARRPRKGVLINSASPLAEDLRNAFRQLQPEKASPIGDWGFAIAPGVETGELCGSNLAQLRAAGQISLLAAGSQRILLELGLNAWEKPVWDCCSGVGGKTRTLLNMGVNVALASDASASRGAVYMRLAAESGRRFPVFCRMDATRPALGSWAGDIIADVPCSGLGVLARRPDLRKAGANLSEILAGYAETQRKILTGLLGLLEPGGRLAYITCTLNPAENRGNIAKALESFPAAVLEREWQTPHGHPWLEGMYGAVLRV